MQGVCVWGWWGRGGGTRGGQGFDGGLGQGVVVKVTRWGGVRGGQGRGGRGVPGAVPHREPMTLVAEYLLDNGNVCKVWLGCYWAAQDSNLLVENGIGLRVRCGYGRLVVQHTIVHYSRPLPVSDQGAKLRPLPVSDQGAKLPVSD